MASDTITLWSSDKQTFEVPHEVACMSEVCTRYWPGSRHMQRNLHAQACSLCLLPECHEPLSPSADNSSDGWGHGRS